jgi:hypothetical protein
MLETCRSRTTSDRTTPTPIPQPPAVPTLDDQEQDQRLPFGRGQSHTLGMPGGHLSAHAQAGTDALTRRAKLVEITAYVDTQLFRVEPSWYI